MELIPRLEPLSQWKSSQVDLSCLLQLASDRKIVFYNNQERVEFPGMGTVDCGETCKQTLFGCTTTVCKIHYIFLIIMSTLCACNIITWCTIMYSQHCNCSFVLCE